MQMIKRNDNKNVSKEGLEMKRQYTIRRSHTLNLINPSLSLSPNMQTPPLSSSFILDHLHFPPTDYFIMPPITIPFYDPEEGNKQKIPPGAPRKRQKIREDVEILYSEYRLALELANFNLDSDPLPTQTNDEYHKVTIHPRNLFTTN